MIVLYIDAEDCDYLSVNKWCNNMSIYFHDTSTRVVYSVCLYV